MPLMIKLNRNIVRVDLCLDNGHFITVFLATEFIYIEDGEIIDIQSIIDDIKIWQWIGRIRVIKSKNLITLFIYTI